MGSNPIPSADSKRSEKLRRVARCLRTLRMGFEDVEHIATSLRNEGDVRCETCTVPVGKGSHTLRKTRSEATALVREGVGFEGNPSARSEGARVLGSGGNSF
jgi:hypothetical protein